MRKQFKRTIALILAWVMIICSIIPNFADGSNVHKEITIAESASGEEQASYEQVSEEQESEEDTSEEQTEKEEDESEIPATEDATDEMTSDESDESETTTAEVESEEETSTDITEETKSETSEALVVTEETSEMENKETDATETEEVESTIIEKEEIVATESIIEKEFNIEEIEALKSPVATESVVTYDESDEDLGHGFLSDDYVAPKTKKSKYKLFGAAPSQYDSRTIMNPANNAMSIVPPVRNQGGYNTCWAFAMIGLFEISVRKKGWVTNETDSNLSEAAMAYFTYDLKNVTGDPNYLDKPGVEGNDYSKVNSGNFASVGGNSTRASLVTSSYVGVVKEDEETRYENMPQIVARVQNGQDGIPNEYAFKKDAFVLGNAIYINKTETTAIKQAIQDYGGIAFAYKGEGETSSYVHEVGGDYYYYTGLQNDDYAIPRINYADHAIIMVGWDDNIPKERFYTGGASYDTAPYKATHNGAWLCRNSWGETRFNGGYFWLSYDEGTLDNTFCAIDAEKTDKYEYNYHYDTTSYPGAVTQGNIRYGNIYKVSDDNDQILEAVSVALGSANSKFDIEIYVKDTAMSNPADGTRVLLKQNIEKLYAGVYTIELEDSEKVVLKKGTYYSVILRAREASGDFYVWADNIYSGTITNYNEAVLKQSFIGHSSGWNDINVYNATFETDDLITIGGKTYGMNWRLKGLTNKGAVITFDGNGADNTMSYQIVIPGVSTPINHCTLTKEGYIFDGWRDESGNEWGDGVDITITTSKTLIAKWRPITYKINYNANGGTVTPSYETKYYGINIPELATPSKAQHRFDGWYVNYESATDTFTNRYYGTTDLTNIQDDDKVIYAKWKREYTITLYDDDGTLITTEYTHTYMPGDTVALPVMPDKDGKQFVAWYDDQGYTGAKYLEIKPTDSGDKNLYARYAIAHTITFASGGGTGNMPEQTMYEGIDDAISTNTFTKSGYSFNGWKASSGASYSQSQVISITEDLTLTAEWKKNSGGWSPGGTGGGGGGGGGGGTLPAGNLPNGQVNQTNLSVDMATVPVNYNTVNSNWVADVSGKWHLKVANEFGQIEDVKNSWACINTVVTDAAGLPSVVMDFYYFDNDGNMLTGWLTDVSNKKYFLETENNSEIGKLVRGWKKIDNKYYYFDGFGVLLTNTVTPDGYIVDANGEWKQDPVL